MIRARDVHRIVFRLADLGHAGDIEWANKCCMPESPVAFAREAIFVICNGGMKNTVARRIFDRVMATIEVGGSAREAFNHIGKCDAIDKIWRGRAEYFETLHAAARISDGDLLQFCESLPWIGKITKYHLAKNFGAQVAKPDVHLARLAALEFDDAQGMCERLARETGHKIATIDVILWRACAEGVINSRTGDINV